MIDAVGMESHGHGIDWYSDRAKQMLGVSFDRPFALRQCIQACRKGGTVSIPGVYGGFLDNFPMGAAFGKGLTFRMGQTHMMKYMPKLLEHIQKGEIDPATIITHRLSLQDAPGAYRTFRDKDDKCIKVDSIPGAEAARRNLSSPNQTSRHGAVRAFFPARKPLLLTHIGPAQDFGGWADKPRTCKVNRVESHRSPECTNRADAKGKTCASENGSEKRKAESRLSDGTMSPPRTILRRCAL